MMDRLYFRQLLAGEDFAVKNEVAQHMANFVYAIGDRDTSEVVLVDPAYDVNALIDIVEADGMSCTGVLATHYHPDHVGGERQGGHIEGISTLLERVSVPIHVHSQEMEYVQLVTGVDAGHLVAHQSGDKVFVGDIEIQLIHTPGHTPGSQCFLVDDRLVAGDTLFLKSCGRTDLPGGDPAQMYETLTNRLSKIPEKTVLYPGHHYASKPSATMGEIRKSNVAYSVTGKNRWLAAFARTRSGS